MKIPTSLFPCLTLLILACTVEAGPTLVFPASDIEAGEHVYRLQPNSVVPVDVLKEVDPEQLASTLMTLLKQASRSCAEQATSETALELLADVAAELDISIALDDLPRKVAAMSSAEKAALYCNSGKTAPASGNLVAFIPGTIPAPSWNLSFHLDTNQLHFDGFTRDADRIRPAAGSPLGADDKAGIAIVIEILRLLVAFDLPHGDIRIVGLVAEEDSAVGAALVEADAFKGDILVSIDGTDPDEIGRAAPTMYNGYISVATQTSHPAEVDSKKALSACAVGAQILWESGFRPDAHPPGHPNVVLHSYFTSCGLNKGLETAKGEPIASYQYNTVSPYWTAAWQMRSLEGNAAAAAMVKGLSRTVQSICAQAGEGRSSVTCRITGTEAPRLAGYIVSEDAASIQLLKAGFAQTANTPVRITARQFGGFNGNLIKQRFNEEMVIVGTGADQIHTNEESVSISGMARVASGLLAAMLESYRYRRQVP